MNILGTTLVFIASLTGFFLQTSEVQVILGESVILPCNGSGFPVEELQLHWEAMGKDVISLSEGVITGGSAFEGRVNFFKDPAESKDFSLVLSDVMPNDGDVYECLWEGKKPICSVLLHVLMDPKLFDAHVEAVEGEDITLECFGNIPKYKPWEEIYIQWLKDNKEILRLSSGKMDVSIDYSIIALPPRHDICRGVFSLTIRSVSVFDQGDYQCRYKSSDYDPLPRRGFPERLMLTVWAASSGMTDLMDSVSSASVTSHTHTSTSVPTWTAVASSQTEAGRTAPAHAYAASAQTEMNSSVPTDTYAASTQTEVSSTAPERAEGQRDPLEFLSDEKTPWIRIGLISGVLLVTAVVLGLLLVSGRI
ncbi:hypothetical protein DPX16_4704 [Anabarilius grahami]|uniref:Ig-like domain-containing protein n=1 Tax=Anabarilius grahami TaxID=495550 RepID=A0A3N0YGT0_ANAGA|nr:hypothetical protein DPX16_4704 [Anabarilius grahami]